MAIGIHYLTKLFYLNPVFNPQKSTMLLHTGLGYKQKLLLSISILLPNLMVNA